jgi:hypothetical protein
MIVMLDDDDDRDGADDDDRPLCRLDLGILAQGKW